MKRKFNILVVDDDLKNIQVGINFLKQNKDYHLIFATSGQQALERVRETTFDLVLLDILMPVMDGYEVCQRLKGEPKTKDIPIIFLTAKHDAESLMKGFELGAADYITKPFNAPELHARVKTHLELHQYYKTEIAKLREVVSLSQDAETLKFVMGGVSHESKNFLSTIPPSIQLLQSRMKKRGIDTEPYDQLFDIIQRSVGNITELLGQLSRLSFLSDSSRDVVDLNEVIWEVKKICKGAIKPKTVFNVEFLNQPALAVANKLHMEQVFLNMLINAQHALEARGGDTEEEGWIQLTVTVDAETRVQGLNGGRAYLCISIEDNGIGMTAEIKQQIFTKYFTTRKEAGGTGLGLAVSKNIIDSHGGTIRVESTLGKGTRFDVYLPLFIDSRAAAVNE